MQEIPKEHIPGLIKHFPNVETIITDVVSNSTYGKFCEISVIMGGQIVPNDPGYREFVIVAKMRVAVILTPNHIQNFFVEYSQKYRYNELEYVGNYFSHEMDTAILKNVGDIITRYTDITSIQFSVNRDPFRMWTDHV